MPKPKRKNETVIRHDGELSPGQSAFVDAFMIHGSAIQAYKDAGYSHRSAPGNSAKFMKHPGIQREIRKRRRELKKKAAVAAEDVIDRLVTIGFGNINSVATWSEEEGLKLIDSEYLTDDETAIIDSVHSKPIIGTKYRILESGETVKETAIIGYENKLKLKSSEKPLEMLCKTLGMFNDNADDGTGDAKKAAKERLLATVRKFTGNGSGTGK